MARLEVPVRTALRFRTGPTIPILAPLPESESVEIEFLGRWFGWLALKPAGENDYASGPTVTTLIGEDTEAAWLEANLALQRLLSALAFAYDQRIESRPSFGGSGETDLLHPFGSRDVSDSVAVYLTVAPRSVAVATDPRLHLALAVYREGLNAGSPFYSFLAFWNVIEAAFNGDRAAQDSFLSDAGPQSLWAVHVDGDPAMYLRKESRNAIAHIIRSNPADTSIDPDMPGDRGRLETEARWLRDLGRRAIGQVWVDAVTLDLPVE